MAAPKGAPPPERKELVRVEDRLSFLYAEHCTVHRDDNALTLTDQQGVVHAPAATLGALLLGPGTRVTHGAIRLLGDAGVTTVWTGEMGVRYYAHGRPLAKSSQMAMTQARLVTNQRSRLEVARAMYRMRFEGEDVSRLTMSQLRGREGARMKKVYRDLSRRTGVEWDRRSYQVEDFEASNPINKALTSANACLYGVTHAVVVSLGCIPSLGFVHQGTDRAFVYDVADLYKAEVAIPAAFESVAASAAGGDDPETAARRRVRDAVVSERLLPRMVRDVCDLLQVDDLEAPDIGDLVLWSELGTVSSGVNYAEAEQE
ncbi:type I-E CRISPR-associated endonuclease Cas1 [Actinomyces lilanjuaniae]|uniref:CRISPR-associated endonuclease Cas1 n=1 Tax=Actinomyces lilanjuaniae TaxID=2321394 RepID=A0ABM6Z3Q7_9ACTO|nr:type I-E CRISPR-associated endonuclease Cas1e [Actinomyces lilanjuaniae]AYD89832.1 type I-E CRISPR-associated endonuclease Cas1 [Actinomyces lilanjuaniae]